MNHTPKIIIRNEKLTRSAFIVIGAYDPWANDVRNSKRYANDNAKPPPQLQFWRSINESAEEE